MDLQARTLRIAEDPRFQNGIMLLIVVNAITIGMETFDWDPEVRNLLHMLDQVIIWIFILELVIRIHAHRSVFFTDAWSLFDLAVVLVSVLPSTGSLSILRIFRIFRALRLISVMPEVQRMVESILRSLKGITAIGGLLALVMYVFGVMATMLYGSGGPVGQLYFGSLGESMYSLFQIMTLESWSHGIVRGLIDEQGWDAAVFFIAYILCTSFTFLNMFIAVFTNTMAAIDIEGGDDEGFSRMLNEIKDEIAELRAHLTESEE